MVARATRVKSIKSENIFFAAIKWPAISQSHGYDSTVITAAFRLHVEAEQVTLFVAGVHVFHDRFYFIGRQLRRHNIILVRKDVPNIVYRFWTGGKITLLVEHAVHHPIDRHATFP